MFLGAGVGGALRYLVTGVVQSRVVIPLEALGPSATAPAAQLPAFPVGTLVVNVSGCLLIGVLVVLLAGPSLGREWVRLAVLVGVLGGFTTFSAFGRETFGMIHDGRWPAAMVYVLVSNLAGFGAVWLGHSLATRLYGPVPL